MPRQYWCKTSPVLGPNSRCNAWELNFCNSEHVFTPKVCSLCSRLQPTPGRSLTFWEPGEQRATKEEVAHFWTTFKTNLTVNKRVPGLQGAFVFIKLFFLFRSRKRVNDSVSWVIHSTQVSLFLFTCVKPIKQPLCRHPKIALQAKSYVVKCHFCDFSLLGRIRTTPVMLFVKCEWYLIKRISIQ